MTSEEANRLINSGGAWWHFIIKRKVYVAMFRDTRPLRYR